jgi:hypothetical protein
MDGLAVKAGYEALWLTRVALAPGQIQETLPAQSVHALGVKFGSSVLFSRIYCRTGIFILEKAAHPGC